jgi:hypothetical protein
VFSLGSVLTFAATGEGPFGGGADMALLYRVQHAQPATGRLPAQIRPLVEQCLAKDPRQRPTADRILTELGSLRLAAGWLPASISQVLQVQKRPGLGASDDTGLPIAPMEAEPAVAVGRSSAAADPVTVSATDPGPSPYAAFSQVHPPATRELTHRRPRRRFPRAWAVGALAAVAVLVPVLVLISQGSSSAPPTNPASSPAVLGPRAAVEAFYAAINDHNWPRVWQLGGKNLGTSYQSMIAGYRTTARDVITSLTANGAAVSGSILAYQTTGAVKTYQVHFVVQHGVITAGHQTLLGINPPSAAASTPGT